MKAEGQFAIQALQNTNLDPDIYLLSSISFSYYFVCDELDSFMFLYQLTAEENEERSALEMSEKKKLEPLIKVS